MVERSAKDDAIEARMSRDVAAGFVDKVVLDLEDLNRTRELYLLAREAQNDSPDDGVARSDRVIEGLDGQPPVRVRCYSPKGLAEPTACLLWIHGGGHVVGAIESDDILVAEIVSLVGCAAVSVDWRQAPEHPYPCELNDCYAALAWIFSQTDSERYDPSRVAVGGASSGGGTAAGLALMARDRGEYALNYELLIYPMLDDRNTTHSSRYITHPKLWNRHTNELAWDAYLAGAKGAVPEYAAPARARNLRDLPPAFVGVGDLDLFLDEDLYYAQRLLGSDVPVELHTYPGAIHGFDRLIPENDAGRRLSPDPPVNVAG